MLVKEAEVAFEEVVKDLSEGCKVMTFRGSSRWEKGIRRHYYLGHFEAEDKL